LTPQRIAFFKPEQLFSLFVRQEVPSSAVKWNGSGALHPPA
jgi:hypothetical protein